MLNNLSTLTLLMSLLTILAVTDGCTSIKQASLEIHYYTIEYDPPLPAKDAQRPYSINIEQFQTSRLYDSNRIVFKNDEYLRDEYIYHKWRAHPGELVSFFLARDFLETGRFKAIFYADASAHHTHLITGVVEDFYQQAGNAGEAILSLTITLFDNTRRGSGDPVMMQKKYSIDVAVEESGPSGLAKAMSRAMQQLSQDIINDVYDQLRK